MSLPEVMYGGENSDYVHIRTENPDNCDRIRTKDIGRSGHSKIHVCFQGNGSKMQSLMIDEDDWDDTEYVKERLKEVVDSVDGDVCISGFNEEDKDRFEEFACG